MWIKEGVDWKLVPVVEAVPAAASDSEVEMVAASPEKVNETSNTSEGVAQPVATAVPVTVTACRDTPADEIIDGIMYHQVQETDTFQGLCLKYKVTPVELRRANKMMGTNLKLAPEKMVIPLNKENARLRDEQRGMTNEEMIAKLVCYVRNHCKSDSNTQNQGLSYSEARAYLEMNDWDLKKAGEEAIADMQWSPEHA